jgi:hypothetical protein
MTQGQLVSGIKDFKDVINDEFSAIIPPIDYIERNPDKEQAIPVIFRRSSRPAR